MSHPENGITFRKFADHDQMSEAAATFILNELKKDNKLLLCPAAGNTPIKTYTSLVRQALESEVNSKEMRIIKLDEWGGLSVNHPASCEYQLKKQLLNPLQIKNYIGFDGENEDYKSELKKCDAYLSKNGPIDICVLGLGLNGHLGFNEPNENFLKPFSHSVPLSSTSLDHSMISGIDKKPSHGLSLGMQSILTSKLIVLLVSGSHKRKIFSKLLEAKIDTKFPASFLWLHHNVICFYDQTVSD